MKSPALMLGYHNRPDLVPMTPDGYYVTGDVFRRDENGFHYFVGRSDDMFVSGGENIYPGDVERMLERHPDVAQACVVPIADEIKGQKPVAFIVPQPGRAPERGRDQGLRARPCAGLPASALRLAHRPAAARLDQQDRPRRAHAAGGGKTHGNDTRLRALNAVIARRRRLALAMTINQLSHGRISRRYG